MTVVTFSSIMTHILLQDLVTSKCLYVLYIKNGRFLNIRLHLLIHVLTCTMVPITISLVSVSENFKFPSLLDKDKLSFSNYFCYRILLPTSYYSTKPNRPHFRLLSQ